jgi:hypothetical protein
LANHLIDLSPPVEIEGPYDGKLGIIPL